MSTQVEFITPIIGVSEVTLLRFKSWGIFSTTSLRKYSQNASYYQGFFAEFTKNVLLFILLILSAPFLLYSLKDSCTFLNHGAFGSCLKDALVASQTWQVHIERQPLRFFDRHSLPHLVYVVRRLAKFVGKTLAK